MASKSYPFRMTLQFDKNNPRHVRVVDYLNSYEHCKSKIVVNAVEALLIANNESEQSDIESGKSPLELEMLLKAFVEKELNEQKKTAFPNKNKKILDKPITQSDELKPSFVPLQNENQSETENLLASTSIQNNVTLQSTKNNNIPPNISISPPELSDENMEGIMLGLSSFGKY